MNPRDRMLTAGEGPFWMAALLVTFIICLAGCGHQTIEGSVTLDGQPLAEGYIAFLPQKDTKGPGAGTKIPGR